MFRRSQSRLPALNLSNLKSHAARRAHIWVGYQLTIAYFHTSNVGARNRNCNCFHETSLLVHGWRFINPWIHPWNNAVETYHYHLPNKLLNSIKRLESLIFKREFSQFKSLWHQIWGAIRCSHDDVWTLPRFILLIWRHIYTRGTCIID